MRINFKQNNIVEIDDARVVFRNFSGTASKFNAAGKRNFSVVIPSQEIADALINDTNKYGVGWKVRIKPPREEGDTPFMHLPVNIRFGGRVPPNIYLETDGRRRLLNEDEVCILDDIDIRSVSLDIRPHDDNDPVPFRTAYVTNMLVVQDIDRFAARFAEEEAPEEMPFDI